MNANTSRFYFYFALNLVFYVVVCQTCNVKALLAYMRCLKRLWCVALEGSRQDLFILICFPKMVLLFAKEEA